MKSRELEKYRRKAHLRPAEPVRLPETGGPFRHFAVMPVMDELAELPDAMASVAAALRRSESGIGVLLVVNHAPTAKSERKRANFQLLDLLRRNDPQYTGGLRPGEELFWIDAASPGRELCRGVGEARRIGQDTALFALDRTNLNEALLFSLDADSHLSPDYFRELELFFAVRPEFGAVSVAARHRPGRTAEEETAIRRYEAYMDHYVEKLREAGSPYAFHTIGSAMAVRAAAYLAAGGMRIRSGAEDFYFLQSVRKVAEVGGYPEPLVFPSPRSSDRVPFGTGPAVAAQLAGKPLPEYPEAGFAELKNLLELARDEFLRKPECFRAALSPRAAEFLRQRGFFAAWEKVPANLPARPGAAAAAFHLWFDGLKTLQFIRFSGGGETGAGNSERESRAEERP